MCSQFYFKFYVWQLYCILLYLNELNSNKITIFDKLFTDWMYHIGSDIRPVEKTWIGSVLTCIDLHQMIVWSLSNHSVYRAQLWIVWLHQATGNRSISYPQVFQTTFINVRQSSSLWVLWKLLNCFKFHKSYDWAIFHIPILLIVQFLWEKRENESISYSLFTIAKCGILASWIYWPVSTFLKNNQSTNHCILYNKFVKWI